MLKAKGACNRMCDACCMLWKYAEEWDWKCLNWINCKDLFVHEQNVCLTDVLFFSFVDHVFVLVIEHKDTKVLDLGC